MKNLRVALVQDAPILFELDKSLDKVESLSKAAAAKGAKLILFPEAFIGGYPRGLSFGTRIGSRSPEGRDEWMEYWQACPRMDDRLLSFLGGIAKSHNAYLGMGLVEKGEAGSSLYCSFLVFSPEGVLLKHHRKIKPTGTERLIWGEGDGSSIKSFPTSYGNMGALICWENYMPLARAALYEGAMDIHLAPTADSRDSWKSSMIHIALEGRCFVLSCNQFVKKEMYPERFMEELEDESEIMCRGGSMVISPLGEILAGPLYDEAGILVADLDLDLIPKSRLDFEANGHYSRPDIFYFKNTRS
ncbi:MAG: carbon-nitrogen hydrolase family protein [Bacteroidia bacterium]|nr:carbon-nitrogen hydrolase family protein [Bacteroidia bacterium]